MLSAGNTFDVMDAFEQDFHDCASDFDYRIEWEDRTFSDEIEENDVISGEEEFYRHLEEY